MTTLVQGPRVLVNLASPLLCTKEPGLLFSASQTRLSHVRGTIHAHRAWRGEHRPAPPSQGFQSAPMTGVAQGPGVLADGPML